MEPRNTPINGITPDTEHKNTSSPSSTDLTSSNIERKNTPLLQSIDRITPDTEPTNMTSSNIERKNTPLSSSNMERKNAPLSHSVNRISSTTESKNIHLSGPPLAASIMIKNKNRDGLNSTNTNQETKIKLYWF